MLYLFNLPEVHTAGSKKQPAAAAAAHGRAGAGLRAPAASAAGAAAQAVALAGEAAALMVQDVPNWDPLGSQINCRFVEQLLSLLPPSQQAAAAAAAAGGGGDGDQPASAAGQPGHSQQQQQQRGGQLPKPARWADRQAARALALAAAAAGPSSNAGPDSSLGVAEGSDVDGEEATAAPGTLRHTLQVSWDIGTAGYLPQSAGNSTALATVSAIVVETTCRNSLHSCKWV